MADALETIAADEDQERRSRLPLLDGRGSLRRPLQCAARCPVGRRPVVVALALSRLPRCISWSRTSGAAGLVAAAARLAGETRHFERNAHVDAEESLRMLQREAFDLAPSSTISRSSCGP